MPKILRVNTKEKKHLFEDLGDYAGLGGRALTSRMVNREVPATCHPLSEHNKIIAAPGVLTGTVAANSGRVSVGGKSPLTGGIKESNSGGQFAQRLAKLDIMALVLEDKPENGASPVYIHVGDDEKVEFEDASYLWGLGTYATCEKLYEKYGEDAAIMVIGPGGELTGKAAGIQFTDPQGRPSRAAGRGGLGAVMGSKKVKAIVVDKGATRTVPVADSEKFKTSNKRWAEILKSHPVTSEGLPGFGTAVLINIINEAGALPTKNWSKGKFDFAENISGETIAETIKKRGGKVRHGCHSGCMIQCSQEYVDESGKYMTSGFEYETIWAMGANTTIKDLDDIARLDHACDDLGLDTIEMGNTIAVAMDGGAIPWGDGKAALDLLEKIRSGDPLGRIIMNGTSYTAEAFGVDRVAVVKNQSLPAYDPRAVKGVGVTYATSTMGGDHTAGYAVAQNILKVGGDIDPLSKEGQVEVSKNLQIATAAVDAAGLCLFVAFAVLDTEDALQVVADLVSAKVGAPFTPDDIVNLGISVLQDELEFNRKAGFCDADDQLPYFMQTEELDTHKSVWDFNVEELQKAKV
jgi:aldehyde:ferredoxin oxidoreductase